MEAATAVQAMGQIVQGVAGYESGKYNRKVARINATNMMRDGEMEAARIRDVSRLVMGAQIGAQAESGFTPGTGTALASLLESATEAELDIMTARRRAQTGANAHQASGNAAYAAGYNQMVGGFYGAAGTVSNNSQDYANARAASGRG
jgi:hypothetical protein